MRPIGSIRRVMVVLEITKFDYRCNEPIPLTASKVIERIRVPLIPPVLDPNPTHTLLSHNLQVEEHCCINLFLCLLGVDLVHF